MKAQAVVQQVVVHQHRGAERPHGAHHGRRVQRCLRHADGAREGVALGHFKPPVCCAEVIKAISLQKEYIHTTQYAHTLCHNIISYSLVLSLRHHHRYSQSPQPDSRGAKRVFGELPNGEKAKEGEQTTI